MIREADILKELPERLERLVQQPARLIECPNSEVDAIVEVGQYRFLVEAKSASRVVSIRRACEVALENSRSIGPDLLPLVITPFMGPSGRNVCDSLGVSFIDLSGNAHIEANGLLIHIEGKPNRYLARGRPSSIFAPKSSRVARVLLLEPSRWWRQSELAALTGLGRGYVSRIIKRLDRDGLLKRSEGGLVRPREPELLLDAWRDEYEFNKHQIIAGHIRSRSGEELLQRFVEIMSKHVEEYALTGLAAAMLLAPFASFRLLAVYLYHEPRKKLLDDVGFREGRKGANVWFILPNDEGVFDGVIEMRGKRCVSAVQVYLDLLHMPERAEEAAEHLRSACMPWR